MSTEEGKRRADGIVRRDRLLVWEVFLIKNRALHLITHVRVPAAQSIQHRIC